MARYCQTIIICAALLLPVGCGKKDKPAAEETKKAPPLGLMAVVPDNCVAFAATAGCDSLKPAFDTSILGRIWNDAEVQTFAKSLTDQLIAKARQEMPDPNQTAVPTLLLDFARSVAGRPFIAGAASMQTEDGPPVYGFVILDAGEKKAPIAAALAKLEALDKKGDIVEIPVGSFKMHGPADNKGVPGYWGWVENRLVFAVNDANGLAIKRLQQPRKAPPENLRQLTTADDLLAFHVDCQAVADIVKVVADRESATDKIEIIATVLDKLGLKNVASINSAARFAGPDLLFTESVEIPKPRTGLLADQDTINLKLFDMVDARAVRASAINCDPGALYDTVMTAVKAASPRAAADIDTKLAEIQADIKFDIHNDLLAAIKGNVLFYSLPSGAIMEAPGGGIVAIAEITAPAKLEKSLAALGNFAAAAGRQQGVTFTSQPQPNGKTLHTCVIAPLAMAQVMPCWMITDDHILIASNPSLHKFALTQMTSSKAAGPSIRTTEGFKKATAGIPKNLICLSYTDSRVQFKQIMLALQGVWPMANMVAAKAGIKLPAMLPSLSGIIEELGPSVQYSWFDDKGLNSIYRGSGLEISAGSVAGAALGVGVLMPALSRTRQVAIRMQSGTNLSGIGKACLIYANDYDGKLPPNLEELIEKCELSPKCLESAFKPKDFDGPSYIYIAGQTTSMDPRNIVAYDNPAFMSEGVNVLYMDSHTEWTKPDEFLKDLEATYKRLGREMPEVKFRD
ncbi:MAG: hypothetical protein JW720_03105 [Sedimentisphaerales bacterium]|nr:hypothetical protein [Sedimentisphaerales bacterium]